jgi:hypothetical protein
MEYAMRYRSRLYVIWLLFTTVCFQPVTGQEPPVPEFDSQNAYKFLVKQCDFGPRIPGSTAQLKCRDYLVAAMKKYADKVFTQLFTLSYGTPKKTAEAFNIIARFQPEKTERILLCAHWDCRPWADADPDPKNHTKPVLGANDGASGVAVLLEIGRLLHKKKPKWGVDIVFFDGEDAGTSGDNRSWAQGSAYYVNNMDPGYIPRYGILLDMIGDADLEVHKEAYSARYAAPVVKKVWDTAKELGIEEFKPQTKFAVYDDHIAFLEAGIPCIDLIDFDYPYWHTIADTPDKCSAASLGKIGRVIVNVIYKNY